MISKTDNTHIMSLEKVIRKLGESAPAILSNDEDDYIKQCDYARDVISAAKNNGALFSSEEMGHILAADFLMQATADVEGNKEFVIKSATSETERTELSEMDSGLEAALSVVAEVVKNSSSYQEALRAGVIAIEECIPYVGGIIAAITSIFWPQTKENVWDQVKDQVSKVVQNAIFEYEYNIVASHTTAVRISLSQYMNSPSKNEKGVILIATMVLINGLYERVNQSQYRPMLIGLMVPIGILHLTVLSERYNHYNVLFGSDDRKQALEDLKITYGNYKVFFDTAYHEWKSWRGGEMVVFFNSSRILWGPTQYSYGVMDKLGLYNFIYAVDDQSRANDFKEWALNRCIADMAEALSGTQAYSTLFKGIDVKLSPILPELDTIVLGRYLWTRFMGTGNMNNTMIGNWYNDRPRGEVNKINIYAYNSIDGLQFLYPDMLGTKVTGGGGTGFELNFEGRQCIGAKLDYASGLVFRIQFFFADGSSSVYGNKGGWRSVASADATVGKSYKLAFANFALGSGPSGTKGINGVIFTFKRA